MTEGATCRGHSRGSTHVLCCTPPHCAIGTDASSLAGSQIALWEEYSCKLEQRVHALTHENDALQRQIEGVQETLAAAGAAHALPDPPPTQLSCLQQSVGLLPAMNQAVSSNAVHQMVFRLGTCFECEC